MLSLLLLGFLSLPVQAGPLRVPLDGYSLTVPDTWKHAEQAGVHVLGSDTEAGLILISYTAGLNLEAMRAQALAGLVQEGLVLMPTAAPVEMKAGSSSGIRVDLQGRAADGTLVGARAVGVAGPAGGVVVLGLTTAEKAAGLGPRVDSIAASVRFFTPEQGTVAALSGTICTWTGSGGGYGSASYSATSRMHFDGLGRVGSGSTFVASGTFREGGESAGGWSTAAGGGANNRLGSYAVSGERVSVRWADGGMLECTVGMRQASGAITELRCGTQLWGAGLCE